MFSNPVLDYFDWRGSIRRLRSNINCCAVEGEQKAVPLGRNVLLPQTGKFTVSGELFFLVNIKNKGV